MGLKAFILAGTFIYTHSVCMQALKALVSLCRCVVTNEPWHGISNNVVCATSKAPDQPAHTRSPIRAFASRLNILGVFSY